MQISNGDLSQPDDNGLAEMRARIGFVFQLFNLMPHLSARENVELGMYITGMPRAARRCRS
jgi:ABC-type lipoprotein export system ATPase subunit